MTTGQRIKEARKKANLTQAELAKKLDVPFQSVSQWERDIRNPKLETLQKIANALDISVGDIYGFANSQFQSVVDKIATISPDAIITRLDDSDDDDDAELHIDLTGGTILANAHEEAHKLIDKLNEVGALRVAGYIDELLENPKYKK